MPDQTMDRDAALAEFLSVLEKREAALLSWGLADGSFAGEDLDRAADRFLTEHGLWGTFPEPDALIHLAEERRLLFPFRSGGGWRYRTRMAETVRLLLRLRQLFPRHLAGSGWLSAPLLIADARFLIRPRVYPRRHLAPHEVRASLEQGCALTAVHAAVIERLTAGREWADFQARAAVRILAELGRPGPTGTVVCAGTGSGKTLAFYLPAFAAVADSLDGADWVRCLAIYPRNELLKDQFTEAYAQARRLDEPLTRLGRRKLRIGALFGPTPRRADAFESRWPPAGWRRVTGGYVCPLLRCPRCGGDLAWRDADRRPDGVERLRCAADGCDAVVQPDEVVLTRNRLRQYPPDVLFTTTEMLNQRMADSRFGRLFGVGVPPERKPRLLLLDEVHTYSGTAGAQAALLLRRWRHAARCAPHLVGLSATLRDATHFFAGLAGLPVAAVEEVGPLPRELRTDGMEYLIALRGDPSSGTSLLSASIQAAMLFARVLDPRGNPASGGMYGSKLFLFTDDLDVTNRLFFNLRDAEGQDSWGNPDPAKPGGSLANLRVPTGPDAAARAADGQSWDLCEWLGHPLRPDTLPRVGRTSSQDAGVDQDAEQIVATAALEVGFNDPAVGAVLQHKAPLDPAAFLQRKGRAGRHPHMRPWTAVVLSDYGRDRVAYQGYDLLFDPELPARELPVGNRHVLRMQAVFALMDWLGFQLEGFPAGSVWQDLSVPASARSSWEATAVRTRQSRIAVLAEEILARPERCDDLAAYLQAALRVSADEIDALLWDPPRALLTAVVPTLLRRLRMQWRAGGEATEFYEQNAPLPDFIPRALFQDLNLPEITVVTPPQQAGDEARRDPMRAAQALSEFAAGRVSRRFGVKHRYARHWVAPPAPSGGREQTLPLAAFVPSYEDLGSFEYVVNGRVESIRCVRPWELHVRVPPREVVDSSNAFPEWRTQIVPKVDGVPALLPSASRWAGVLTELVFFTHAQNCPVEVRRFAIGSEAAVGFEDGRRFETHIRYTGEDAAPAAVGFAHDADAAALRLRLPEEPHRMVADRPDLLRVLRPELFRYRVKTAPELDGVVNVFGRQWLAQAYMCAAVGRAAESGGDLGAAVEALRAEGAGDALVAALDVLFQALPAERSEGETEPDPDAPDAVVRQRAHKRLLEALDEPAVAAALNAAASVLVEVPGPTWDGWLSEVLKATVGAAALDAVRTLCPDVDAREVLVDTDSGPRPAGAATAPAGLAEVWLTETAVGGGGVLEKFQQRHGEDPRRFFDLVSRALEPTDFELADAELTRFLGWAASPGESDIRDAAARLRSAHQQSHEELSRAWGSLLEVLRGRGLAMLRPVLAALNARVLRPGSSERTDRFLHDLVARSRDFEARLGVGIDGRTFAWLASGDREIETSLPAAVGTEAGSRAWRFGALSSLLWPRGGAVRGRRLKARNPFADLTPPERTLAAAILPPPPAPVALSDPAWPAAAERALLTDGVVRLAAAVGDAARAAILHLASEPIDTGLVLGYAQVRAADRLPGGGVVVTFEFAEGGP